jgi:hypothetical protein
VTPLPGCEVRGLTQTGDLHLRWAILPSPLVWNWTGGADTEPEQFVALGWEEAIPGNPNIRGALSAWLRQGSTGPGLVTRFAPWSAGPAAAMPTSGGTALVLAGGGATWTRVSCLGARVTAQATVRRTGSSGIWGGQRADGRNSGASPLRVVPTGVTETPSPSRPALALWPNPAAGRIRVSWEGIAPGDARLAIYDMRGRLVRRLGGGALPPSSSLVWDGRTDAGRPVGAGVYLFVLAHRGGTLTGRVVLTR